MMYKFEMETLNREKIEEDMDTALRDMMEYERQIRVAKEAEEKLEHCRRILLQLMQVYLKADIAAKAYGIGDDVK